MNPNDLHETRERYDRRLAEFGPTDAALGWGPKGRSKIRFEILSSRWHLTGSRILDLGCGFGDLFGYLSSKNIAVDYIGVDINPSLISIAEQRYPAGRFMVADVLAGFNEKADYVLSSGVFNHQMSDNRAFIAGMLEAMDTIASSGFATNFLSNRVDYELPHTYHTDPAYILDLAYKYSRNVVLRNDYMPFEFTIFVDKASAIDRDLAVYEEYVCYEKAPR